MKYVKENNTCYLSVRELVTYALSLGDLDCHPQMVAQMQVGKELHKYIQTQGGPFYHAEVPLHFDTQYNDVLFHIDGRADGIIGDEAPIIDEIKTSSAFALKHTPSPLHLAQLRCYAYFYAYEHKLKKIHARLTRIVPETKDTHCVNYTYTIEELAGFFEQLISLIFWRVRLQIEQATIRIPSAKNVTFPFSSMREGQENFIKECYKDISTCKQLFACIPTGTGKTISTLYAAVRAIGSEKIKKIFYLTAKASTGREAFKASEQLFLAGAKLRTVMISARESMCANAAAKFDTLFLTRHCNAEKCIYAKNYYTKLPSILQKMLQEKNGFTKSYIEEIAKKEMVCPYELSLDLSELCDIIICDYNYCFDPQIQFKRYFADGIKHDDFCFLIDEAHNLLDRSIDMYSTEIHSEEVQRMLMSLPKEEPIFQDVYKLYKTILSYKKSCKDTIMKTDDGFQYGYDVGHTTPGKLLQVMPPLQEKLDAILKVRDLPPFGAPILQLSSLLHRFLLIANFYDEHFATFVELKQEDISIRIACLDSSALLKDTYSLVRSTILFSATLFPKDYFMDLLGGDKNSHWQALPSPFPQKNFCLLAATHLSTRFEDRKESIKGIISCIAASISAKKGNYIVFFPSYSYMEEVSKLFIQKYPTLPVLIQKKNMSHQDKDEFIENLQGDGKWRIGFCVLGGSFSEGIDLPGNRLIGVIVVGTGMPGISANRNLLMEYHEGTRERGYDYAYTYPGFHRVLQAAGRVIRTQEDKGMVLLIDDRYAEDKMKVIYPPHWSHLLQVESPQEIREVLDEFWNS